MLELLDGSEGRLMLGRTFDGGRVSVLEEDGLDVGLLEHLVLRRADKHPHRALSPSIEPSISLSLSRG